MSGDLVRPLTEPLVNQRPMALLFGFIRRPILLRAAADSCTIHYLRTKSVDLDTVIDEIRGVPFLKLLISGPKSLNFWRNFEQRTLRMPRLVLHLRTSEVGINNRFAGRKTAEEIGVIIDQYREYLVEWNRIREEYLPFVREVLVDQTDAELGDDIRHFLREWSRDEARRSEQEGIKWMNEKQVRAMLRENHAESDDSDENNEDDSDSDEDHSPDEDGDDSDSDEDHSPDEDGDDSDSDEDNEDNSDSDEDHSPDEDEDEDDHSPDEDEDNEDSDSDDSDEDNEDDSDSDEDHSPDEDGDEGYEY